MSEAAIGACCEDVLCIALTRSWYCVQPHDYSFVAAVGTIGC